MPPKHCVLDFVHSKEVAIPAYFIMFMITCDTIILIKQNAIPPDAVIFCGGKI